LWVGGRLGLWSPAGPTAESPPPENHQPQPNNPPPDRQRTDLAITTIEDRYELRPPRATRHRQNTIALRLITVSPR
jgi:hypothetical protein